MEEKTITVYVPVFLKMPFTDSISTYSSNPGIGGSQFTSLRLALFLAKKETRYKVVVVSNHKIPFEDPPSNISQLIFDTLQDFFQSIIVSKADLIIGLAANLHKLEQEVLKRLENNIICWSRHPFDSKVAKILRKIKLRSTVCVGEYQFHSNKTLCQNTFYIQNIFIAPKYLSTQKNKEFDRNQLNIVHLGALVPGKGFLNIAKSWERIKLMFPGAKLHVIGSSGTHGVAVGSDLVPTFSDYAEKILAYIPEADIKDGQVIFYGNLGEEKFGIIQNCDVALLNPTGATEAFPASPLECMACGVPVIASDDFGMSDCMKFFPELSIKGHQSIANKISWLIEDRLRYQEMCERSLAVSNWFESQTEQILTRWLRLIEAVTDGNVEELKLQPILPFYGSNIKLFYRQHRQHIRFSSILKALINLTSE